MKKIRPTKELDISPDPQKVLVRTLKLRRMEWIYLMTNLEKWEYLRDKIATQVLK